MRLLIALIGVFLIFSANVSAYHSMRAVDVTIRYVEYQHEMPSRVRYYGQIIPFDRFDYGRLINYGSDGSDYGPYGSFDHYGSSCAIYDDCGCD